MPNANIGPYPGGAPRVSVDSALRFPRIISRALTALVWKRFVADRIFMRGSADQVAGGAMIFQRSENIFMDRGAEEVGVRSEWPRSGWTTDLFMAAVKKYGLEAPISDEAKRRNAIDVLARAQVKIANSVVSFVDGVAMALIVNDPDKQTYAASGVWSNAATDKVADIANMRSLIVNIEEGYEATVLIVNPTQETQMIIDKNIRDALPREGNTPQNAIVTGRAVPLLGLDAIVPTKSVAAGTEIMVNGGIVGTIADEEPLADENYIAFNPGTSDAGGQQPPPIYVKRYRNDDVDETILRGARFPAMGIGEPKAAVVGTGF